MTQVSEKNEREGGRMGERTGKREERMERETEERRILFFLKKSKKQFRFLNENKISMLIV